MDAKTLNKIIHELDENLAKLEAEPQNLLVYYESAAGLCWLALNEMRKLVIKNGFQNQQAEIQFFKHIKPKVFSKYIYYYKLFEIESYRHNASKKFQIKYLNQVLKNMHRYLEENMQFCQYHWGNKKYMDHLYFVRDKSNYRIHFNNLCNLLDYKFSTAHDTTVSTITAYEKLIEYIDNEMDILIHGTQKEKAPFLSKAKWTGSNVALVELIYALQSLKVINNGNIEIKELAEIFEKMFNVKLDEYYRVFSDIQMRKTNHTKFLDMLKDALNKRIDEAGS